MRLKGQRVHHAQPRLSSTAGVYTEHLRPTCVACLASASCLALCSDSSRAAISWAISASLMSSSAYSVCPAAAPALPQEQGHQCYARSERSFGHTGQPTASNTSALHMRLPYRHEPDASLAVKQYVHRKWRLYQQEKTESHNDLLNL